jgi:putative endonuclease
MPYAVYILLCADGTYYTGLTRDLEARLDEHREGRYPQSYTFTRRPVRLAWSEVVEDYTEALQWEQQIKKWTHRKKEALIQAGLEAVHELVESERRHTPRRSSR